MCIVYVMNLPAFKKNRPLHCGKSIESEVKVPELVGLEDGLYQRLKREDSFSF